MLEAMRSPKKKHRSMKAIEKELWHLCRIITFKRYGTDCFTCPQKNLQGANLQCGHAYPKGALGASMKYDLRILRPQCFICNIHHGGMGAVFWNTLAVTTKNSRALFDECRSSKGRPVKARDHYTHLIDTYTKLLSEV